MPYTDAANKATQKYLKANKERLTVWLKRGELAKLKQCAADHGYNAVSRFVIDAINEKAHEPVLTMPKDTNTDKE